MINSVTLGGNLTSDSTLRTTAGGMGILSFGIAVNERKKDPQTGEWVDVPSFFDCTLFGSRAEKLAGYLMRGTKVVVSGFLRQSSWEKDGQRRSKVEVIVNDLDFLTRNQQAPAQQPTAYSAPTQQYSAPQQPAMQAPQAPMQPAPNGQAYMNQAPMGYQQPQYPQAQQPELYDESIPF